MKHKARQRTRPGPAPGSYVTCGECGKRGYESRALARTARALRRRIVEGRPGERLDTYECTTGMWHLGHSPMAADRNDPRLRWIDDARG